MSWITATARPRNAAPLKFQIKVVDSVAGKPKSKYFLGETVSVVFTLTNQKPPRTDRPGDRARNYTLILAIVEEEAPRLPSQRSWESLPHEQTFRSHPSTERFSNTVVSP